MKNITVAVDCRMMEASGIGVYLRGIMPSLIQSGHNFFLLGNQLQLQIFAGNNNCTIIDCNIKPFSFKELFLFSKPILKKINSTDIFYTPFFNIPHGIKIPVCTTIHDIIFPDMPELCSVAGLAARMWFYRRAHKNSKKIFTVSGFSKSRIEYHLGTSKPVIVTHSAVQHMLLSYKKNALNTEKKEIIVFVGNVKKNKGLDYLLDAFILAKNEGLPHKLIIIGEKKNFRSSDNKILGKIDSAVPEAVSFTGFVSDEQLMKYLSTASLLVQPSLYEGFGLPPLEAMVLGTKTLISDIPVFREIYSEFPVVFFKAGDAGDLKTKMMEMLFNKTPSFLVMPDELLFKYTFEKTAEVILRELQ